MECIFCVTAPFVELARFWYLSPCANIYLVEEPLLPLTPKPSSIKKPIEPTVIPENHMTKSMKRCTGSIASLTRNLGSGTGLSS